MNKHQRWALWIGVVIFVLYAMTYSPYCKWPETQHISPAPRGNLFRSPQRQTQLDLDTGRFAVESGFIVLSVGGVTLALSARPRHGDDVKV